MRLQLSPKIRLLLAREFLILLGTLGLGCILIIAGVGFESPMTEKVGIMFFLFAFPLYLCFRLGLWWFDRCNRYPL